MNFDLTSLKVIKKMSDKTENEIINLHPYVILILKMFYVIIDKLFNKPKIIKKNHRNRMITYLNFLL